MNKNKMDWIKIIIINLLKMVFADERPHFGSGVTGITNSEIFCKLREFSDKFMVDSWGIVF